jgi:hypothetical protein
MQFANEVYVSLATRFVGEGAGEGEVLFPERLARPRLDYTLASLQVVDDYLAFLRQSQPELMTEIWTNTVLWAGSYLGEVIRRHAGRPFHWVEYDEFMKAHPDLAPLFGTQRTLPCHALLTYGRGSFLLPMYSLIRSMQAGVEEKIHAFAAAEIQQT